MISLPLVAVGTALVVLLIVAKLCAGKPKRAEKSEKAQIMKQLLALSEREHNAAVSARPGYRASLSNQGMRSANAHRKTTDKRSRPIRSSR
jgi:hypothetical protein